MENDIEKNTEEEVYAPGWDAITNEFDRIYPGQTNPKHYAPMIKYEFGGNDPLRGISVYDAGDSWHFVSYGLTELYEKKSPNKEIIVKELYEKLGTDITDYRRESVI